MPPCSVELLRRGSQQTCVTARAERMSWLDQLSEPSPRCNSSLTCGRWRHQLMRRVHEGTLSYNAGGDFLFLIRFARRRLLFRHHGRERSVVAKQTPPPETGGEVRALKWIVNIFQGLRFKGAAAEAMPTSEGRLRWPPAGFYQPTEGVLLPCTCSSDCRRQCNGITCANDGGRCDACQQACADGVRVAR